MSDTTQTDVDAGELERDLALLAAREGLPVLQVLRDLIDLQDPSPYQEIDSELLRRTEARLPFTAPAADLEALSTQLQPEVDRAEKAISDSMSEIHEELSSISDSVRTNSVGVVANGSIQEQARLTTASTPGRILEKKPCLELLRLNANGRSVVEFRVFLEDIFRLVLQAKKADPQSFVSEFPGGAR